MAFFVSASASSTTAPAASLLRSPPSASIVGPWAAQVRRSLLAAPLRAAAPANGSVKMMESKVKKKNKKGAGAGGLPAAIDLEIREAEQYLATDIQEPAPENFPFEIVDEEGMSVVILKKDYKDEKIEVIVSMPNMDAEPEFDEDDEDDDEDAAKDEDDDEDEAAEDSSLSMKVVVSKGTGPKLEFTCTAFREEITIDDMLISEKAESDAEKFPFEGPEFTELPPNVQKGLFKFLELRGVTLTTTNFMHDYMVTKQTKEYVRWMTKLKELVKQ